MIKTFTTYGLSIILIIFTGSIVYNIYAYRYSFNGALVRTILYPIASTTIWAPDFSEAGFSKVKVGTSKNEVLDAIGRPLIHSCDKALEADEACDWIYTRQGTNLDAYDRRAISFDDQGKADYIWHEFYTN